MKIVLIKIGGSTVDATGLLQELGDGINKLIRNNFFPVVVHGGGKDIARNLKKLNREFEFIEGQRVTDPEMMETVQMVLSGDVNKRIVNAFLTRNIFATGISGVDGALLEAEKLLVKGKDIGLVGKIKNVNPKLINICKESNITPVISPVSRNSEGTIFNVNADVAASEIAIALNAEHLIFISDVQGVLINKKVKSKIRCSQIDNFIESGDITGGMIPKLQSASEAVSKGVGKVHICSWQNENTLVNELDIKTSNGTVIY